MNVCCRISALLVLAVVTVKITELRVHSITLGWRLVADHSKATEVLAKSSIVVDTKGNQLGRLVLLVHLRL